MRAHSIPGMLVIKVLRIPIRGFSKKTHPMAERKLGVSSPKIIRVWGISFGCRSVRSTSQAAGTPNNNATANVTREKMPVFSNVL